MQEHTPLSAEQQSVKAILSIESENEILWPMLLVSGQKYAAKLKKIYGGNHSDKTQTRQEVLLHRQHHCLKIGEPGLLFTSEDRDCQRKNRNQNDMGDSG